MLVAAVVRAFVDAKLERADVSAALYAAAAQPGAMAIVERVSKRTRRALVAALAHASGTGVSESAFAGLMLHGAMAGAIRAVLEAGAPAKMVARLREELPVLCQGYAAKALRSRA